MQNVVYTVAFMSVQPSAFIIYLYNVHCVETAYFHLVTLSL